MSWEIVGQNPDGSYQLKDPSTGQVSSMGSGAAQGPSLASAATSLGVNKAAGAAYDAIKGSIGGSASSAGGAATGNASLDTLMTPGGPGLGNVGTASAAPSLSGILAGAYTGYQQAKGVQDVVKNGTLTTPQSLALALPTFGASLLVNPINSMTKSHTRGEEHERDALRAQGINILDDPNAPHGKSWELNQAFAQSRNVKDLTGKDITGAADFYAQIPGYQNLNDATRQKIAQDALTRGLVTEGHGKINLTSDPTLLAEASQPIMPSAPQGGVSPRTAKKARAAAVLSNIDPAQTTNGSRFDLMAAGKIQNPYA